MTSTTEGGAQPLSPPMNLPVDPLQQILTYVTLHELLSLSCCSKSIHKMINHTYYLCYQNQNYAQEKDQAHLRQALHVQHSSSSYVENFLFHASPSSSSTLGGAHGDRRKQYLLDGQHALNSCHPHHYLSVPQLTQCLKRFRYLRTLRLYHMGRMEDHFLPLLNASPAKHTLMHLELHNVRILKDGHKLQLPEDCSLTYMEVEGTLFCTYDVLKSFAKFQKLKVLKLCGCRRLKDCNVKDMVQWSNEYGTLQELRLEDCSKLVAPVVDSPSLHILSFARCNILRDLSFITCQNLLEIDLSYCSLVDNQSVHSLMMQNPNIQKMSLRGNRVLSNINIASDYLKELDLGMCMGLESCTLQCQSLVSLEMGMCLTLQDLHLEIDAIKTLDLSMLTITDISIQSLMLETLILSGCCKLMSVRHLSCPRLQELDICGTNVCPKSLVKVVGKRIKIKSGGGDAHDWTDQFHHRRT